MLPRSQRLTTTQFDRAFANSQTLRHPLVSVRLHFRGDGESGEKGTTRAAFVVPKKQARKATQRNLIRRRLRERYRLLAGCHTEALAHCDLIFMSTPQTLGASHKELDIALQELLERASRRIGRDNSGERGNSGSRSERGHKTSETPQLPANVTKENDPLSVPVGIALSMIRFYQRFISPGLPPSCRFEPTCSRYTYASIERFGVFRGTALGASRICRCHPWHEGGYDPVPDNFPALFSKRPIQKKFSMRFFRSKPRNDASL